MNNIRNQKFTPDATGGGKLEWEELVHRKGFRPAWVKRAIHKQAHVAKETDNGNA